MLVNLFWPNTIWTHIQTCRSWMETIQRYSSVQCTLTCWSHCTTGTVEWTKVSDTNRSPNLSLGVECCSFARTTTFHCFPGIPAKSDVTLILGLSCAVYATRGSLGIQWLPDNAPQSCTQAYRLFFSGYFSSVIWLYSEKWKTHFKCK